jgi:hypothetical protein
MIYAAADEAEEIRSVAATTTTRRLVVIVVVDFSRVDDRLDYDYDYENFVVDS